MNLFHDPRSIETSASEPTPWSSAPDPAVRRRLDRLLARIPSRLARTVRLHHLEGLSQREVGLREGILQSSVSERLKAARARLRWVAEHLPDLTAPEVEGLLVAAGEPEAVAATVALVWTEHSTSSLPVSQSTAWSRVFGATGFVVRRGSEGGQVGEIARGLIEIRGAVQAAETLRSIDYYARRDRLEPSKM